MPAKSKVFSLETKLDIKRFNEENPTFQEWIEQKNTLEKSRNTIYKFGKEYPYHAGCWITFFILSPVSFYYWYKLKNKKINIISSFDEIREKFESWRFSIFSTLGFFIVFFALVQQALTEFRLQIEIFTDKHEWFTFAITALLLGILAIGDGFISSNLKTNLQRLSFNIQESVHDKELKKKLFLKSQEGTETLKETFKKFGMLAIPALIIRSLGSTRWNNSKLSYAYYAIPVAYSFIRIQEVNSLSKKTKLENNE